MHCVSSEIPNRGSLGRSLSCTSAAACKTPKDGDKVASSELRPPGWCEVRIFLSRSVSNK